MRDVRRARARGKDLSKLLPASILLLLTILACQPDDSAVGDPRTEIRDSAGVRIIENPRPPDGSRLDWRIGPEPVLSIGEADGEDPYLLFFVRDAMRLRDGRIVVANGGSDELRFFDALGGHLATRGGSGEGPGEFERLLTVEPWPGDSIAAWSAPQRGISVFDTDGRYGRTFTLAAHGSTPGFRWNPGSATRDGGFLAISSNEDGSTIFVQVRDGEGEVLSSLGTHAGTEPRLWDGLLAKIYGRRPVVVLWGDLVIITTTSRYELKAFTRDGRPARIVGRGHEPRAPTEAEVLVYMEEGSPPGMSPGQVRERFQGVPVAEHFPAFGSVRSDRAGHLWVREYDFPLETRAAPLWTVFDPDGRMLGFVETPKDLRIREIGEDYILGLASDEFGVEFVQLWPLDRSGG